MKRVNSKSIKFISLPILVFLAIILFIPACQDEIENHPSARFVLKGVVLSDTLEKPLEGIIVVMQEYRDISESGIPKRTILVPIDSAVTDANGLFEVTDSIGIPAEIAYNIAFIDTGKILKASKEKIDTSVIYKFTKPTFTNGDGHWYAGETLKTETFRLEVKK